MQKDSANTNTHYEQQVETQNQKDPHLYWVSTG